ncbi:SH3 domain-containing protein [Pseudomonas sp. Fl5BN2]|uniref:SH3 domain-containing protein n=1 Tax=unclassified Pseudomonas TaxID=196821 RepID=UPI001378FC3A|nr:MULTISPECIES: SH3 domain-containing protein [unclassified Pseudomonas]NBF06438.1 SH3 domain-containing protein [Pseudomonas sp. Fl5BN2]NBF10162.1 SH3 domain-containing protein [Pseudomonas sp. Fl4BN1]
MDRPLYLLPVYGLLLLLPLPVLAETAVDCATLSDNVSLEAGAYRPPLEAKVIGAGRLHFHSGPNAACVNHTLYVVPDDVLTAYASSDNGWTQVMYIAKDGEDYTGWVEEKRLQLGGHYGGAQLPADVTAFIQRHEECLHFAGEEPYDAERRAFLEKAVNEVCVGHDRQLAALRKQYQEQPLARQALASLENLE